MLDSYNFFRDFYIQIYVINLGAFSMLIKRGLKCVNELNLQLI